MFLGNSGDGQGVGLDIGNTTDIVITDSIFEANSGNDSIISVNGCEDIAIDSVRLLWNRVENYGAIHLVNSTGTISLTNISAIGNEGFLGSIQIPSVN